MTTDAPGDMIRMQNPNQAKRCLPEMAGAAIFIPERRIPSRALLSFACGITAAPRKAEVLQAGHFAVSSRKEGDFSMYQKIKAKFKASPTIFYACSIVASWAGVGSLMNFRTIALRYGAVPAIIWAVFNSLACITFGLFADRVPSIRRIMQSKVMFYFIGLLTLFQTWTQMSGIYEIFGDTPIGTKGGMIIVYVTCVAFLIMLLKDGMIRNVLSDGFSWVVVYGLLAVVVAAALVYTGGTFAVIDPGVNAAGIKAGVYNGLLLLPGPFACPYYYSLFEYNDENTDGTKRSNMKKAFVLALSLIRI